MGIEWITLLMFGSLFVLLMPGIPIAFATGSLGVIFITLLWSPAAIEVVSIRIFGTMYQYLLFPIPLFIFLANILQRAGVIEEMYAAFLEWIGALRGGLATATVLASTVLAAIVGVIGAAVVTMGLVSLGSMLERKYDKNIALGSIMAGGALGVIIPPSILLLVYAMVAGESVGKLFAGGILPGLLLAGLYIGYITTKCYFNPQHGPALSKEERAKITWGSKLKSLNKIIMPTALIILILGSIFTGAASITEAAGIGVIGAMIIAAIKGRLTWENVKIASFQTAKVSAMVLWTIFGATIFVTFYLAIGGGDFITNSILGLELGKYGTLIFCMLILIFLGMFLDWVGIMLLTVPIFLPIMISLGFDPLWFGIVFNVCMQLSFLTPPFGYALFFLKGVAPPEISTVDIYKAAVPFIILQIVGLILVIAFPQIALFIPNVLLNS